MTPIGLLNIYFTAYVTAFLTPFLNVFSLQWKDASKPTENQTKQKVKVKWSRYRPGVAHRVGRGIPLLFNDRGTRRG